MFTHLIATDWKLLSRIKEQKKKNEKRSAFIIRPHYNFPLSHTQHMQSRVGLFLTQYSKQFGIEISHFPIAKERKKKKMQNISSKQIWLVLYIVNLMRKYVLMCFFENVILYFDVNLKFRNEENTQMIYVIRLTS